MPVEEVQKMIGVRRATGVITVFTATRVKRVKRVDRTRTESGLSE